MEPWDETYYTRMMKSSVHNLDSSVRYPCSCKCGYGNSSFFTLYFHIGCVSHFKLSIIPSNVRFCLLLLLFPLLMQVVASYFPLPQCIVGLEVLANSLFGVGFHSVPMAPGESWHPDVLKMCLRHPQEVYTQRS